MDALGIIEFNSIAGGIEAGDEMVKSAAVQLLCATPVCPGKYIVMVGGNVSAVESAVAAGARDEREFIVGRMVIASVHPQVFTALNGTTAIDGRQALGVVETFSLVSAVYAADAAVKAADVQLGELRLGRGLGGKAYFLLLGDVSAVKHAVEAAGNCEQSRGMVLNRIVLPSPHQDILNAIL